MSAQQSVRISTRISANPSVWIHVKFSTGDFYEICPDTQILFQIDKKNAGTLHSNPFVFLI
jgi:hypothetical protein